MLGEKTKITTIYRLFRALLFHYQPEQQMNVTDLMHSHRCFAPSSAEFVISAGAYTGYLRGGDNAGVDGTVESLAAPYASPDGIGTRLMARLGEPIGFAFVGTIGGLFTGYFWNAWRKNWCWIG